MKKDKFPLREISPEKNHCPLCNGKKIVKSGVHYNKLTTVQRYRCKTCGTTYCNQGYFKAKFPIEIRLHAMALYNSGLSLEKIRKEFDRIGYKVSNVGIHKWLQNFNVKMRPKSSGNQKQKTVRNKVELCFLTVVRLSDSYHPEKIKILQKSSVLIN